MARRKTELFNLSLLDLLTSALGAIIFLFIVTPKGGQSAAAVQQAVIYLDTAAMKIHGDLADSLRGKVAGDTLFAVVIDHEPFPQSEAPQPEIVVIKEQPVLEAPARPKPEPKPKDPQPVKIPPKPEPKPKDPQPAPLPVPKPPTYRGDAPSVPCLMSVEISWPNKAENVDLYVCKGNDCVYGGNKRDRDIGQWDSGKSRNRLFGNDLRTNQEAVRQFDEILPGEYKIYAAFKESGRNQSTVTIKGLIYTKGVNNQERGDSFSRRLAVGKERQLIGTLILRRDGRFTFK